MPKLGQPQIRERLKTLKGWSYKDGFIVKSFEFKTFMDGIRFVDDLAVLAERLEHHPDIHIRWTSITLMIQTHDEGGVTPKDFQLATEIEDSMG